MKFVFVDPPSPPGFVAFRHSHGGFGECCKTSRLKFPTLDLFHGATILLEGGLPTAVVDSVLLDHDAKACARAVAAHEPTHVVIRTASGSCPHDLAAATAIKAATGAKILVYGAHVATEAATILAHPAVDAALAGDGLGAFQEMARRGGWDKVPGVVLKGANLASSPSAPAADLTSLPTPRWDLVDFKRYSYVTTQTSWGCPFGCGYCPYPVTQGSRWLTRPMASVVEEFLILRRKYGLRFVLLRDPEFTLKRARTIELCRALIAAGTPLMWGCETRLETLDEELISLMAQAGCVRVAFGVDSVNPATLRLMGRTAASRRQLSKKVGALKKQGILTYGMYIVGLPGETPASTRRLVDYALSLDTNAASFSMATPFPGTRLEQVARQRGLIGAADPLHLTSCVPSMKSGPMTMAQVEKLYLKAKAQWKRSKRSSRR